MKVDRKFPMPSEFWIIIAVGSVLVVLLALFLGRTFKLKWGKTSVETGEEGAGVIQNVRASGGDSSVKDVKQQSNAGIGKQEVAAEQGGSVEKVDQNQRRKR
jgi:hypothetical protein